MTMTKTTFIEVIARDRKSYQMLLWGLGFQGLGIMWRSTDQDTYGPEYFGFEEAPEVDMNRPYDIEYLQNLVIEKRNKANAETKKTRSHKKTNKQAKGQG